MVRITIGGDNLRRLLQVFCMIDEVNVNFMVIDEDNARIL